MQPIIVKPSSEIDRRPRAVFGSPTRFSNVTWQLKHFIDQAGALWMQGQLVDKVVSAFTSASTPHGGHESTLIALYNVFYNWGCIIVPPGYADPVQFKAGTPFGATHLLSPPVATRRSVGPPKR